MDEFFTNLLSLIVKAQNELKDAPFARIHGAMQCLEEARDMIADIPSGSVLLEAALRKANDIAIVR